MKKIIFVLSLLFLNTAFAAVDFSGWAKYADNLQNCKPGTFNLPDPLQALGSANPENITYQIMGMNAGVCKVVITRIIQVPGSAPATLKLNCAFAAADLPTLSKTAVDTGNGTISTNDPSSDILNKACQQTT